MDVTTAVAEALGQIGEQQPVPGLAGVLLDGKRPLPARQALADAQALPQMPRLLRRMIESTCKYGRNVN
jgi:HEAT repeat protein